MGWPEMSFMRLAVSRAYRGDKWKEKVRAMSDQQVIALYFVFKERGMFDPARKAAPVVESPTDIEESDVFVPHQMTFDELFTQKEV